MKKIRLFCLPYAGASATIYYKWKTILHSSIELQPIELAGRGSRMDEPFYNNFEELIYEVFQYVKTESKKNDDYVLFGHSLGGQVVFEIAYRLQKHKLYPPKHIIISGRTPPHLLYKSKITRHKLPDEELKMEILNMNSLRNELKSHMHILDQFLPMIRNDFRIIENHKYVEKKEKLGINTSIFYGIDDPALEKVIGSIEDWKKLISGTCEFKQFDGGHLFIQENEKDVVDRINKILVGNNNMKLQTQ